MCLCVCVYAILGVVSQVLFTFMFETESLGSWDSSIRLDWLVVFLRDLPVSILPRPLY